MSISAKNGHMETDDMPLAYDLLSYSNTKSQRPWDDDNKEKRLFCLNGNLEPIELEKEQVPPVIDVDYLSKINPYKQTPNYIESHLLVNLLHGCCLNNEKSLFQFETKIEDLPKIVVNDCLQQAIVAHPDRVVDLMKIFGPLGVVDKVKSDGREKVWICGARLITHRAMIMSRIFLVSPPKQLGWAVRDYFNPSRMLKMVVDSSNVHMLSFAHPVWETPFSMSCRTPDPNIVTEHRFRYLDL